MITSIFWLIPMASLFALGFAWYFFKTMMRNSEGNDDMKRIARYVREGAMAYLKRQYTVVLKVFGVMVVLLGLLAYFNVQNPFVPLAFFNGWFFLRALWLSGYAHRNLCLSPHSLGCNSLTQPRASDCFQIWCRNGSGGCGFCLIGHCSMVLCA